MYVPVCVTMPTTVSSEGAKHHLLSSIPENQKILPTTHRAATIQSAIDSMNIGWICRETTYGNEDTAILSHHSLIPRPHGNGAIESHLHIC